MGAPGRFSFVDEGEAVRRLGVDRDTVLSFVRSGRLKAYPGVGKGSFFRTSDLEKLASELHPPEPPDEAEEAEEEPAAEPAMPKRAQHDPAYKVQLRLQADLKWYDLTDDDLRLWVRELHPQAYSRYRGNITTVIGRLERLMALMDEAARKWENLPTQSSGPDESAAPRDAEGPSPPSE
jgi:hypothetical protein